MITVVDHDPRWPERFTRLRDEYAAVKRRAVADAADIDDYGQLKNAMVQRLLAAAGLSATDRASIDRNQVPSHADVPR